MGFGGYQTALCFSRQRGVGVAVLCNAGSDSYELSQARSFVPKLALTHPHVCI
jgi:hypothetical protein